jgi:hypothetical protein
MAKWEIGTSDEEIDSILADLKKLPPGPVIEEADYHLYLIKLDDGRRFAIPREQIEFLASADPAIATHYELLAPRTGLWWPEVDDGLSIDHIIAGRYGRYAWMKKLRDLEKQVAIAA